MNSEFAIVMSQCVRAKAAFGIRFVLNSTNVWRAVWAFEISEAFARREGYDRTEITGRFEFDQNFPGCPYCQRRGLIVCSCGKVSCHSNEGSSFTCPWCHESGSIGGAAERMTAGGDL